MKISNSKTLILMATYFHKERAMTTIKSLYNVINGSQDFEVIIIDNNSRDGLKEELQNLKYEQISTVFLKKNIGKANAMNSVVEEWIKSKIEFPEIIISMDSDITFSRESLDLLCNSIRNIPNAGMIGMRYIDNGYNPEKNLPNSPTKVYGENHIIYPILTPQNMNVAGGVFGIRGSIVKSLLEGKFYPNTQGKVYCGDDAFLYHKLKDAGLVNGYLEGTFATHHGEDSYLYSNSKYGKWKRQQLTRGGSRKGYFDRKSWNIFNR